MTVENPSPLVPKLRFPEFQRAGDWKRDQIGNVASITKGKGISKADITKDGAIPCIRYADLYTHYHEVIHEVVSHTNVPHEDLMLSQAEDVIVPASGETRADIARAACVLPERVALGSDLNILRSDLYGPFFSYLLNSPLRHTIARMSQGDTVAHLYPKQLLQVWLAYPLRPEQQKIADCLGSLDDLIAAEGRKLEALRQHKQGLMQQLFPRPGETVPRLRFPEFRDALEWSTARGDTLFDLINNRNAAPGLPVLAITQEYGAIPRDQIDYHVSVTAESVKGYKEVCDGDFIISLRSFQGGIEYSRYHGICSPAYVILRRKGGGTDHFFRHLFKSDRFIQRMTHNIEGLRDGKIISYAQFSEQLLPMPEPHEQQKIADCLGSLDVLIAAENRKLEALRQHKRGLMQQLFPAIEVNRQ